VAEYAMLKEEEMRGLKPKDEIITWIKESKFS